MERTRGLHALHGVLLRMWRNARTTPPSDVSSRQVCGPSAARYKSWGLPAAAGALRLATLLGSSANERDDVVVHSYQLILAALRNRSSCSAAISDEVMTCVGGHGDGFARYMPRIRASRDAATRLFGLELLRELCRDRKAGRHKELAEEYYMSSAALLPLNTCVTGSTSAKFRGLFSDDAMLTCCNLRHDISPCLPDCEQRLT